MAVREADLDRETLDQLIVAATLVLALVLFAWARWRYDMVALAALLTLTVAGIVPAGQAFAGFGHAAVITVAAVLVVSKGLENSGLVDMLARWLMRAGDRPTAQIASNSGVVAGASAFMNNVGALALLMPAAIRVARQSGTPRSTLLMPLAFASMLGGMVTLIGTPPNIIIATIRGSANGGQPFAVFDFAPVGGAVAIAGLSFLALVGWRLIPRRPDADQGDGLFDIAGYLTEVQLPEESDFAGRRLRELMQSIDEDFVVVALVRGERRYPAPSPYEVLRNGDVLAIEADAEVLSRLVEDRGLQPVGSEEVGDLPLDSEEVRLVEAVVRPGALIAGRSARDLRLRERYGVNLLAVAREGGRIRQRLHRLVLRPGDVVLLQGPEAAVPTALSTLGCLPLAERGLRLRGRRSVLVAAMILALALLAAAGLRLLPIEIAVAIAAVMLGLAGFVSLREAYEAIDWPVLVLLGAMIPVGGALESTGAAARVAGVLVGVVADYPLAVAVTVVLVSAMLLSDVLNNAAAAVLLAPIALGAAAGLGVSSDALLMAVAVGASCAFLTPIGHQSNILVMGPGGYRFSDYWRVGLPLEVVVVVVAVPAIVLVWG